MAKPNYKFAKRQRDLAAQAKKEEKANKRRARDAAKEPPKPDEPPATGS
jgi:hypothetical protein